jgi:hypothetical protein
VNLEIERTRLTLWFKRCSNYKPLSSIDSFKHFFFQSS